MVKLVRTPNKSSSRKQSEPSQPPEAETQKSGIISGERVGLMSGREGLLGEYYNNL